MVAESLFGMVQYGDVNVRFAPAPQTDAADLSAPSTAADSQAAPPVTVKQEEGITEPAEALHGGLRRDDSYWDRRRRNNEAAKRSREKRRLNDLMLESRVAELTRDNFLLRAQLNTIRDKFGIVGEQHIDAEQVLAQLPPVERILGFSKRPKSGRLLQLSSTDGQTLSVTSTEGRAPSPAGQFRPVTPPSAPVCLAGREPAPFVYRQQSLRELPHCESVEVWRGDATPGRLTPEFTAAVNLSRSAGGQQRRSPPTPADWCTLPLKLRHKTHLGGGLSPPRVKDELHDWPSSGDERDSGVSAGGGSSDGAASPSACKRRRVSAEEEAPPPSAAITSQLQRLSSEVATLRSMLSQRQTVDA